jgi:glycosyltransferase involved in cell wall biosynthesis
MRIAILTTGRFWVCDLARELDALGHEVAFYSLVPPWRTRRFGLPDRSNRWLGPYLAPLVLAARLARGTGLEGAASETLVMGLDRLGARLVDRCDVLIAMSGMSGLTAEAVRRRYGARVFVERGSRHVLSQQEILESIPHAPGAPAAVSDFTIRRELQDYASADLIVVPARHVESSFTERGVPSAKLFRNPFGVDLSMFPPTAASPQRPPVIGTAGTWSYRKGCDVLTAAWRRMSGVRLAHVGPIADAPVPNGAGFQHFRPVEQRSLGAVYSKWHVFALASREEGLALVQGQALASGLRLVCTDRTGGEDYRELLEDDDLISVVPVDDPGALAAALGAALERSFAQKGLRDLLGARRDRLSWAAYGLRYDACLRERA